MTVHDDDPDSPSDGHSGLPIVRWNVTIQRGDATRFSVLARGRDPDDACHAVHQNYCFPTRGDVVKAVVRIKD